MTQVKCPAKLNLWLRITGIRKDGYHLIDSLFVPIDLYDKITITESQNDKNYVSFVTPSGTPIDLQSDTVTKSLKLMNKLLPKMPKLKVQVTKFIPMGAGLGGGSTNAAAVLKFLQENYGTKESGTKLAEIAQKIGADVSFFLDPKPSHVSGVGEIVRPMNVEQLHFVICYPAFQIPTTQAYGWFDEDNGLTRDAAIATLSYSAGASEASVLTVDQVSKLAHNDLEKPVEARHPEISMLKKALRHRGALKSLMTGSGSSVFGIYQNQEQAILAVEMLKKQFPPTHSFFITKTLA